MAREFENISFRPHQDRGLTSDRKASETIELPGKQKLRERLAEAAKGLKDTHDEFCDLLLKNEGRELTAEGIVMALVGALDTYAQSKKGSNVNELRVHADAFIRALTPGASNSDRIKKLRARAEDLWKHTLTAEGEPVIAPEEY